LKLIEAGRVECPQVTWELAIKRTSNFPCDMFRR